FATAPPVAGVSGTARTCKCREVGSPACLGTPIDLSEVLIVPASPRAGAELGSGPPRSDRHKCRGRGGGDRGARARRRGGQVEVGTRPIGHCPPPERRGGRVVRLLYAARPHVVGRCMKLDHRARPAREPCSSANCSARTRCTNSRRSISSRCRFTAGRAARTFSP